MTIAQAREAAKRILDWQSQPYSYGCKVGKELANFILDHFPEDGEERVTEEWLIEEWRFERHKSGKLFSFEICGWWSTNSNKCMIWWYNPSSNGMPITTRHQARQLFQALGIKKRGEQ